MQEFTQWVLAVSAFAIVLGYVALLKSKIYVDPRTQSATEIELPFFGKMKSNYPALVFVFAGAALAAFAANKNYDLELARLNKRVDWTITGNLTAPDGDVANFRDGAQLVAVPSQSEPEVYPDGRFVMHVPIPEGKTFESEYDGFTYTRDNGTAFVQAKEESKKYERDPSSSLLDFRGDFTRNYKNVPFQVIARSADND